MQLRNRVPVTASDPLETLRTVLRGRACTFKMKAVSPEEAKKIVDGLKIPSPQV